MSYYIFYLKSSGWLRKSRPIRPIVSIKPKLGLLPHLPQSLTVVNLLKPWQEEGCGNRESPVLSWNKEHSLGLIDQGGIRTEGAWGHHTNLLYLKRHRGKYPGGSISSLISPLDGLTWQRTWGTRRVSPMSGWFKTSWISTALHICSMSYRFYVCLVCLMPLESWVALYLPISFHLFQHTEAQLYL